jgi:hypothetical protein
MLIFSQHQMGELAKIRTLNFESRAVQYIRDVFPSQNKPTPLQAVGLLERAFHLASENKLDTEEGIISICKLMLVFGPNLLQNQPWANYILRDSDADCEERVARLEEYFPDSISDFVKSQIDHPSGLRYD